MKEFNILLFKKSIKNGIELFCDSPVIKPLQRLVNRSFGEPKTIILLYHNIVPEPPPDRTYFHKICLTTDEFRQQMNYLVRHNRVISLSQYISMINNSAPKIHDPNPLIIITFDDGYQSVYTEAYPILKKLGIPATIFVSTGFIGADSKLPGEKSYPGINYPKLNWEEVGELARNGFEIGSHTITHPHPDRYSAMQYSDEIRQSTAKIQNHLDLRPVHFSWPYGKRHRMLVNLEPILKEAGFLSACYACGGKNTYRTNPYYLNRIGISTGISFTHFRRITEGLSLTDCLTRKS